MGTPATLRVTVAPPATVTTVPGTLVSTPSNVSTVDYTFLSTVSRALADSYDGPTIFYRPRVKLNDTWIPDADVGPIEISGDLDSHTVQATVELLGRAYAPLRTTTVWGITPVEIWLEHGRAGAVRSDLRLSGAVFTCSPGSQPTSTRLEISDVAHLGGGADGSGVNLCFELDPSTGETRGGISTLAIHEASPDAEVEVPDGPVYGKPVQVIGRGLFDFLKAWHEPEGWKIRRVPVQDDPALERWRIWRPELKLDPTPPDAVWGPDFWESLSTQPPQASPSRWILRAEGAVSVDELGVEIQVTDVTISRPYAPSRAVQAQDSSGTVTTITTYPAQPEVERPYSRVVDQVSKRGSQLIYQHTREYGWKNPAAAKAIASGAGGTAPGGYHYVAALIDDQGRYVVWPYERFMTLGLRFYNPHYDGDGTLDRAETTTQAWRKIHSTAKANAADTEPATPSGALVGDDDESYQEQSYYTSAFGRAVEGFGLTQIDQAAFTYTAAGAELLQVVDSYGYYARRAEVDSHAVRASGVGHATGENVAPWRRFRRVTLANQLSDSGELRGVIETPEGYTVTQLKLGGTYDWGDFSANLPQEIWRVLPEGRKQTIYRATSATTFEEVEIDATGTRPPKKHFGSVPLPRFQASPWTLFVQEPIEVVLVDDVALELFGARREAIEHPYVLTAEEALRVLEDRRQRLLAFEHTVTVPLNPVRDGDTVHLVDPETGVDHRCLVASWRERLDGAVIGATYVLEQPLATA